MNVDLNKLDSTVHQAELNDKLQKEKKKDIIKMILLLIPVTVFILWLFNRAEERDYKTLINYMTQNNCKFIEINKERLWSQVVYQCGDVVYRQDVTRYTVKKLMNNKK